MIDARIEKVKKRLPRGGITQIATKTNTTRQWVSMVFNGKAEVSDIQKYLSAGEEVISETISKLMQQ